MDNILTRISEQKLSNVGMTTPNFEMIDDSDDNKPQNGTIANSDEPLSMSEIGDLLESLDGTKTSTSTIEFDGIYTFVAWYEKNRQYFNERQKIAFETLATARMQINLGCSCRKDARQRMANDYYKFFFESNKLTDLIPAVKAAAKVETIILKLGEVEFLRA